MKRILLSAVVLSAVGLNAQSKAPAVKTEKAVGIETSQPRATLDVNGDARLQKVEEMATGTSTEEKFPNCPCVLTIDKYGVIKRIPSEKFMMSGGSTVNPGGPITPTPTPGTGDNQSTGGANLGNAVNATIEDQDDYVVSFIYDGHQLQGKIDDSSNKVVVKIPYTGGNGVQYSEATSTTTTTVASSENGRTSPITMTIKGGTLSSGNGELEAEITTPALYNVKKLAPGAVETIAEFKYTLNNQTKTVVLKAVGGIPDKKFSNPDHKFVYIPVTVKIGNYNKVWLNQNLGADYANLKGGHFNPKKVGGDNKRDYKAYGSMFQFGREADGHELMTWGNGTSTDWSVNHRAKKNIAWNTNDSSLTYSKDKDPCPNGYHTPSKKDWQDLHQALTGSRMSGNYSAIWDDTAKLNLAAAGAVNTGGSSFYSGPGYNGYYWSSTTSGNNYGSDLGFYSSGSNPQGSNSRSYGLSVRCLKN